jgi:type VI protein secretion system component VasF
MGPAAAASLIGRAVKGRRLSHESRASRNRRDFWKRLGVWIFIIFFALSVAGGLIVVGTSLTAR